MENKFLFRGFCLVSMLVAGSCTAGAPDAAHPSLSGSTNHPISVEPAYQSIKLYYSPADAGIQPSDQARFNSFVANYEAHGNGAIAVNAPAGMNSQAMIGFFAQRINDMGVSKDRILVATHDAPDGDMRVEINYISYQARTDACGDWSQNLAITFDNDTPRNFGCAVQHNIDVMTANPRDLAQPQQMTPGRSGARAYYVIDKYTRGEALPSSNDLQQDYNFKIF